MRWGTRATLGTHRFSGKVYSDGTRIARTEESLALVRAVLDISRPAGTKTFFWQRFIDWMHWMPIIPNALLVTIRHTLLSFDVPYFHWGIHDLGDVPFGWHHHVFNLLIIRHTLLQTPDDLLYKSVTRIRTVVTSSASDTFAANVMTVVEFTP